jgi:hypothetical protein
MRPRARRIEEGAWMLLSLIGESRAARREVFVELVARAAADRDAEQMARRVVVAAAALGDLVEDVRECVGAGPDVGEGCDERGISEISGARSGRLARGAAAQAPMMEEPLPVGGESRLRYRILRLVDGRARIIRSMNARSRRSRWSTRR